MQEKENVLKILEGTKKAIDKEDIVELKSLSDRTVHTASISQDPDNIAVAVIVYSLSKIIEREQYKQQSGWNKFYKTYIKAIDNLILAIKGNDDGKIKLQLETIRKEINALSGNLKKYIQDVFRKASINKASKIYEHGISLEQTANLLGISIWELASYAGQKTDDIISTKTLDIKQRIKIAEDMFK